MISKNRHLKIYFIKTFKVLSLLNLLLNLFSIIIIIKLLKDNIILLLYIIITNNETNGQDFRRNR